MEQTWEIIIPKFIDYIRYEKTKSKYKANDYRKKMLWISKRIPFPFSLNNVRDILSELRDRRTTPAYQNYYLCMFNSFIRWCELEHLPQENLVDKLNEIRPHDEKTPDPNDLLSVEEIKQLISSPIRSDELGWVDNIIKNRDEFFGEVDNMYNLLFEFIYKTGCRSGEAVNLRKKDFNFSNESVTFYGTKTGDDRTTAVPPDMEERLKEYLKDLNDTEYLFKAHTHKSNQPISQEMANKCFKYRARLAKIERSVHIHMLRHSSISHMLISGAPLAVVQAIVGHRRLATTQLYTHIVVNNQRDAMIKYNPLIRSGMEPKEVIRLIKSKIEDMNVYQNPNINFNVTETPKGFKLELEIV